MQRLKKYNTRPLGDIMKALKQRKHSFQRRAQECSRPRIPALPNPETQPTVDSQAKLKAVEQ